MGEVLGSLMYVFTFSIDLEVCDYTTCKIIQQNVFEFYEIVYCSQFV